MSRREKEHFTFFEVPIEYEDLLEELGDRSRNSIIDWNNYCGRNYHLWENAVKAVFRTRGFTNPYFVTGDGDSFGPLTRVMKCSDPNGRRRFFVYG